VAGGFATNCIGRKDIAADSVQKDLLTIDITFGKKGAEK